jgi:hypothetical protein
LVLSAVADNGIVHQNAFEAITTEEEFDDKDLGEVACIIIGDHYYPSDDESMDYNESSNSEGTDPLAIVLIDGQDDSTYETNESMGFDDEFSYDNSIESNELLPSLILWYSSSSSECSTVGNNANIQTVICEASYVCDTDEDSSAATFTSHDDSVIKNIRQVQLDSRATNSFHNHPNITKLGVPITMEQSVRRYLDDIVLNVLKPTGIMGRPSQNIATMDRFKSSEKKTCASVYPTRGSHYIAYRHTSTKQAFEAVLTSLTHSVMHSTAISQGYSSTLIPLTIITRIFVGADSKYRESDAQ